MMLNLSNDLLDGLVRRAEDSVRSRQFFNIHKHHNEPCQRLLNAINIGSYIQPHRHINSKKKELLVALRGKFALITFSDQGELNGYTFFATEKHLDFATNSVGIEMDCECWHTVIAIKPNSVLLEVKEGPFDDAVSKDFAPWAPAPYSDGVDFYIRKLYNFCGVTL